MAMLDLFDQQALTEVIRRNIEEESNANDGGEDRAFIGADFAPLVSVASRTARISVADVEPYGMGQFKSPGAPPPLFKPRPRYGEKLFELVESTPTSPPSWNDMGSTRFTPTTGNTSRA